MSAKERFLQDKSGAFTAEWGVMLAAALTICMVIATALSGSALAGTGL
jgi:Flp pilus assembly pilin Flp